MKTRREKRVGRTVEIPELNVTPFMNLMIVLVPVLLLSLVFTHTTVVELDFPGPEAGLAGHELQHLEVSIMQDELVVADQGGIIKRLPKIGGEYDFTGLNQTMLEAKQQMPTKRDALILLEPTTNYQALIFVLDSMKSFGSLELFPDVSLGDVPNGEAGAS